MPAEIHLLPLSYYENYSYSQWKNRRGLYC